MIRAILVDDEPNALELLELYIGRIPFVDCVAAFRNPLQALEFLHQNPVDIIFLDINILLQTVQVILWRKGSR